MLQLLQANNMAVLVDELCARFEETPPGPIEPEIILVQSHGMGQWIKHAIARKIGIAANISACLPAEYIWQLYLKLLPDQDLPGTSAFEQQQLTWRLFFSLTAEQQDLPTRAYIGQGTDSQLKAFQLGEKLARCYDEYLLYRPDWIADWEQADTETDLHWQARLWRSIRSETTEPHRVDLHTRLMARLAQAPEKDDSVRSALPRRITLFGLSSLPVLQLETLQNLARHIDVDIYFLNPCEHYWGDIVSRTDLARRSVKEMLQKTDSLVDDDYLTIGNPLLSSMGKQGREFLELLLDVNHADTHESFVRHPESSVLNLVKNDILELNYGGVFSAKGEHGRFVAPTGDRSIQIHGCHSKLREVEVLLDQLWLMIEQQPDIQTRDIIVMTPDITAYAPYIDAVFKGKLNYTIADLLSPKDSQVLLPFLRLINLPESRVTSNELLDLMSVEAIARKFEFSQQDLTTIAHWIAESGIRWGLNGEHKSATWGLPEDNQNTWSFGLNRLLMGYALEADAGIFRHILPLEVDSASGELLGRFIEFVKLIEALQKQLLTPKTPQQWQALIEQISTDFFLPEGREELDLAWLTELIPTAELSEANQTTLVDARIIQYWLTSKIQEPGRSSRFLRGGITFATLVPMRSIPFRIVCLLGMNDADYPRREAQSGINLIIQSDYRKGDRSRRLDDRYLFLEALLSATDHFYLSYEARSARDNQEKPPSVLVSELQSYLGQVFGAGYLARVTVKHPLQPFNWLYYADTPQSPPPDSAEADRSGGHPPLHSYNRVWYEALCAESKPVPFCDMRLDTEPSAVISLEELLRFFRNPSRYFFEVCLNIFFTLESETLADTETFAIGNLLRYQLTDSAAQTFLSDSLANQISADLELHAIDEKQTARQRLEAITVNWMNTQVSAGTVMNNDLGQEQLTKIVARAEPVVAAVIDSGPRRILSGELKLDTAVITGSVDLAHENSVLNYRVGDERAVDRLSSWIKQVYATALTNQPLTATRISLNKKELATTNTTPAVCVDVAKTCLATLIELFRQGQQSPLPFMPGISFDYAKDGRLKIPDNTQFGNDFTDAYFSRAYQLPEQWSPEFAEVAHSVFAPMLRVEISDDE